MPMPSLDTVLTATRHGDLEDHLTIPPGFGQGKATFGGVPVGACVRSMEARVGADRPLRAISSQLLGAPSPGVSVIRLRRLRASNTVTTMTADLEQDGQVMTHVVGVFGKARPVERRWNTLPRPDFPSWRSLEPLDSSTGLVPEFTRHFEYRTVGPYPYADSMAPVAGYVRPAERCERRDGGWLSCLIDAWWIAAFTAFSEPRPAATVTLNAEFHAPVDGLDPDEPLLHAGACHWLHEGYGQETRQLWGHDGRLLVTATELIAVIK
jgi:acyl-CoA thioesterase